jgi:SAM-dependent methyltransferase
MIWGPITIPLIDKDKRLQGATPASPVRLELGCGTSKRDPLAIGVDLLAAPGVDVVGDAAAVLTSLPDRSVSHIYSEHFLEHIDDLQGLLSQVSRVLTDGGTFVAVVPHFSNPYFYSDPTHKMAFGLYTFCYLADSSLFARTTPKYDFDYGLQLERVTLGFKASRPFYVRYAIRRAIGYLVNLHRWGQEFWEDVLSGMISCYEIEYRLRRKPRS